MRDMPVRDNALSAVWRIQGTMCWRQAADPHAFSHQLDTTRGHQSARTELEARIGGEVGIVEHPDLYVI